MKGNRSEARTAAHLARCLALVLAPGLLLAANGTLEAQPIGSAFRVNTTWTGRQERAAIASASNGSFTVVWGSYPAFPIPGIAGVVGQRFDSAGMPLGGEFRVDSGIGEGWWPAIASDPSGDFVVAYVKNPRSTCDIYGQRFSSSGAALGPEFRVNTYTTGPQEFPAVAEAANGAFVVVWRDRNVGTRGFHAQRFAADGAPVGLQAQVATFDPLYASPAVASDAAGNFVVAWDLPSTDYDVGPDIWVRRFAEVGEPLGPEFRVNTYTTRGQAGAAVASSGDGGFTVLWVDFAAFPFGRLEGQRFSRTGAALGPEFRVDTSGAWSPPSIVANSLGQFVVAWDDCLAYLCAAHVFGQRFAPTGAKLGTEFLVSIGEQPWPDAALDLNGDFVIAWNAADDYYSGIYARRYQGGIHGDVNGDGGVDVRDILDLINYLFAAGPAPVGAANVLRDDAVDVRDVLYLINYLFAGGPPPG